MAQAKVKLLPAKEVGALINKAHKGFTENNLVIHAAGVQCLAHAEASGDYTLMQRLVGGIIFKAGPDGKRSKKNGIASQFPANLGNLTPAIKAWVARFSPIAWGSMDEETGLSPIGLIDKANKTYKPFDVEAANKTPFWELPENIKDSQRNPFDLLFVANRIGGIIKQFEKAKADGSLIGDADQMDKFLHDLDQYAKAKLKALKFDVTQAQAARLVYKGQAVSDADKNRPVVTGTGPANQGKDATAKPKTPKAPANRVKPQEAQTAPQNATTTAGGPEPDSVAA